MFEVDYFEDARGRRPVEDFIDSLDPKMKAKIFGGLELLERYGACLGMPYARHVEKGIYELRTIQSANITRIFYFFVAGERIILTHGFVKKTRKTPRREIERAFAIREDWRKRNERL